ncbi:MAG: hypothetical protein MUD14_22655 [Hydrococcus sp. Prado102]|jgi:hypothetical protein|nr:hypothetical protein [Hydrococcus sp. Prado102]
MFERKRNPHAKTAMLVALLMSSTAVAPIFSSAPASAQLFPSRDRDRYERDRSFSRRVIVPEGTEIPVRYDEAEKILVTKDETVPVTLEVAANIRNRNGDIIIPSGSEIVGEIQPVESEEGSQFVAETLVIKEDGETIRERSIDATSDVVTRTETVEEGAGVGDILKGAAIGGAAAAVISAILGDKAIATEEVLGGAGLGALAGWILGDSEAELISIDPNSDLTLTLNSDLVIRR